MQKWGTNEAYSKITRIRTKLDGPIDDATESWLSIDVLELCDPFTNADITVSIEMELENER